MKSNNDLKMTRYFISRIIFIILFFIISIFLTLYLINNYSKDIEIFQNDDTEEKTVDLKEYYNVNQLKIENYEDNYNGVDIEYYQIDGLKNIQIQNEINNYLKNDIIKEINKKVDEYKINYEDIMVYPEKNSSFQNTLSVSYHIYSYDNDEINSILNENFDLATGKKIILYDIFKSDTKAADIMNQSLYIDFINEYAEVDYYEDDDALKVTDYNDVEDELLEFAINFNNRENMDFSFDERGVYIDGIGEIYYKNCLDKVVIYDKYKTTESIFTGEYNTYLKPYPVLAKRSDVDFQIIESGRNYYIDVSLNDVYEKKERNEKNFEFAKQYIIKEVEELKRRVNKKSDEFLIANYSCNLYYNDYYKYDYTLTQSQNLYWTTRREFNLKLKNRIIESFRNYCDDMFIYDIVDDYDRIYSEYVENYIDENGVGEIVQRNYY